MRALELTLSISALANAIASTLEDGEVALISSILVQLGDTLATILVQREAPANESESKTE